jgi:hypothetical protein
MLSSAAEVIGDGETANRGHLSRLAPLTDDSVVVDRLSVAFVRRVGT